MNLCITAFREALDGVVPAYVATCAPDDTPNITAISQVQYVDGEHVALSYQFFNKTRRNLLANPVLRLMVAHPFNAAQYRLTLRYLRTETEGPLYETMKAKLAGIASHVGMTGVFRLQGADLCRILELEQVPGEALPYQPPVQPLPALRSVLARTEAAPDLESLLGHLLDGLERAFAIQHAMVLLLDARGDRLYTLASRGYPASGVGSEIALGEGVIGVCAASGVPIRIGHPTSEYAYGRMVREQAERGGLGGLLDTRIPLPGLARPASQMALPIQARGRILGVLFVESPQDLRFSYDDEDALAILAARTGLALQDLETVPEAEEAVPDPPPQAAAAGERPLVVRHFTEDDSVFLDGDYLIKGVAGSILWAMVRDHVEQGRTAFSNRELRLDPRIRLPDLSDNLEARLVLLGRRLVERGACLRMEKTGRGRFQLRVGRPLELVEVPATLRDS